MMASAVRDVLFRNYPRVLVDRFVIGRSMRTLMIFLSVTLALSACMYTPERASNAEEADHALIAGYGEIRAYRYSPRNEALARHSDWMVKTQSAKKNILMISSGGGSGAFGVGVLAGWTTTNTRPRFDVVTGVSTGALIAPYAFLGPAYDKLLVHQYTSGVAQELVALNGPLGLFGSSLLKAGPLKRHVERFITPHVLNQIAAEHHEGRRLFVLTTNLDTQRGVIWNMGAIAASENPDALKLFRDVIVASASVPGVFPPVQIQAVSNGRQFQELHSDGGSISQVLTPPLLVENALFSERQVQRNVNLYVIVNNALIPEFDITPNRTVPALGRAYSLFLKSQAQSELTALYNHTRRTGASFHVASIEVQVPYSMLNPLSKKYMQAVYRFGYEQAASGTLWKDTPAFPLQLSQPLAR
ncbi:patatin-like phospholipase family protein [Mesorhizobium sp. CAU 1732]|uniref:patatin-like phospholipase family protein n=1 Tax=Mesorhizobium sp. CAU 1732 TaxID=3140358 RepID=UPI003260297B